MGENASNRGELLLWSSLKAYIHQVKKCVQAIKKRWY